METQMTRAAHAARRGQKDSFETMCKRASYRQRHGVGIGAHECVIATYLSSVDIPYIQQFASGKYNFDFLLPEHRVVIEVVSGGGNVRVAANRKNRRKHILSKWNLFEIKFHSGTSKMISKELCGVLNRWCEHAKSKRVPGFSVAYRPDGRLTT